MQKQDSEALRAVAGYAQELRVYRAAQTKTDHAAAANTHHSEQATANESAAKSQAEGISDDVADWDTIAEKGIPAKASIVTKTISEKQNYYF